MIDCFRYYAGWADKIHGQTIPVRGNVFCVQQASRWEWSGRSSLELPHAHGGVEVGPGMAAGCTVVLKPAEQTPLTALRMGELALRPASPPA